MAMSQRGAPAATELVATTGEPIRRLTPADWIADTACRRWRVVDVVGHLASFFNCIADPGLNRLPTPVRLPIASKTLRSWRTRTGRQSRSLPATSPTASLDVGRLRPRESTRWAICPLNSSSRAPNRLAQLADAVAFDHLVHLHSVGSCRIGFDRGGVSRRRDDRPRH